MSTDTAKPTIDLKILYSRLEDLYRTRQFDQVTLKIARQLLEGCFREHQTVDRELTPEDCRMLAVAIEVADYFEIQTWGTGDHQSDNIYDWLVGRSEKVRDRVLEKYEHGPLPHGEDLKQLVHEIRFSAAGSVNLLYRLSDYDQSLKHLDKLIAIGGRLWESLEGNIDPVARIEVEDMMCYLHFLAGKAARKVRDFILADEHFQQSANYLLRSALTLTRPATDGTVRGHVVELAHFRLRRLGVVENARAWNFLASGRIHDALWGSKRAALTVAESDSVNRFFALSTEGIAQRMLAGKSNDELNKAIEKLTRSYNFFFDKVPMPRAIRCLYELEVAFIITGRLEEAVTYLEDFTKRIRRPEAETFSRLLVQERLTGQFHLIKSRIARKDQGGKYVNRLHSVFPIQRRESSGPARTQAVRLAIEEARRGIANEDRLVHIDGLLCLAETSFAAGDFARAEPQFHDLLRASGTSIDVELIDERSYRSELESEFRREREFPFMTAVALIYLARIAAAEHKLPVAEFFLRQYRYLPPQENKWLLDCAREIESELQRISSRILVVDLGDASTLKDFEKKYRIALNEKYGLLKKPVTDLSRLFKASDSSIKHLRMKLRAEKDAPRREKKNAGGQDAPATK